MMQGCEKIEKLVAPGRKLSNLFPLFCHWLLIDPVDGVINFTESEYNKRTIKNVASLYQWWLEGNKPKKIYWKAAQEWTCNSRNEDGFPYHHAFNTAREAAEVPYRGDWSSGHNAAATAYQVCWHAAEVMSRKREPNLKNRVNRMVEKWLELENDYSSVRVTGELSEPDDNRSIVDIFSEKNKTGGPRLFKDGKWADIKL